MVQDVSHVHDRLGRCDERADCLRLPAVTSRVQAPRRDARARSAMTRQLGREEKPVRRVASLRRAVRSGWSREWHGPDVRTGEGSGERRTSANTCLPQGRCASLPRGCAKTYLEAWTRGHATARSWVADAHHELFVARRQARTLDDIALRSRGKLWAVPFGA